MVQVELSPEKFEQKLMSAKFGGVQVKSEGDRKYFMKCPGREVTRIEVFDVKSQKYWMIAKSKEPREFEMIKETLDRDGAKQKIYNYKVKRDARETEKRIAQWDEKHQLR